LTANLEEVDPSQLPVKKILGKGGDKIMVTEKQLVANRENGKKGGPKTAEGKANIRLNALKQGLFAKDLVLDDEERKVLKEIWQRMLVELEPQSIVEEMLIEFMASSFWRRQMAIRLETDYLNEQFFKITMALENGDLDAFSKFVNGELGNQKGWQNVLRYQTSFENKFFKSLHELERLQMARRGTTVPPPLAVDLEISKDG
jgi:hypothetical protein